MRRCILLRELCEDAATRYYDCRRPGDPLAFVDMVGRTVTCAVLAISLLIFGAMSASAQSRSTTSAARSPGSRLRAAIRPRSRMGKAGSLAARSGTATRRRSITDAVASRARSSTPGRSGQAAPVPEVIAERRLASRAERETPLLVTVAAKDKSLAARNKSW